MAAVKPEVKVDAEERTPVMDRDDFEEDTDLQIPNDAGQTWLIKCSEAMWKAWAKIYNDMPEGTEQIEIGKFRVFNNQPGSDPTNPAIQIRLNDDLEEHKMLPKTYNLDIKSNGYNNTVVFSEKDLPAHANRGHGSNRYLAPGAKPFGVNKQDRYNNRPLRKPGSYRTAIPRQTALAPPIHHEAIANPVDDSVTLSLFTQSYNKALAGSTKTRFDDTTKMRHPGMDNDSFAFGSLSSKPGRGGKKKAAKEKAVRMDKDKLLDALKNCFKQYQYWSLRALRQRLRQPEAYIKEMLDDIAILMKSGDFVQNYKLKPEYERMVREDMGGAVELKGEPAPVKMEESDDGSGDELDTGEEDFEDVDMKLE